MCTPENVQDCCDIPAPDEVSSCCCCGPRRRFLTKKEKLERLETYREQLEKELVGVEERIKEVK